MGARRSEAVRALDETDAGITTAAIGAYRRLRLAVGGRLETHASGDGGLICEQWISPARPNVWRIEADGSVVPDTIYNYALRAFVPAGLPAGLA